MSGGGFTSFMNSIIKRNRELLKKKRCFKERSQIYDVSDPKKVNYEMKEFSDEEKTLKRKLKKSENDKSTIIYSLASIIILSVTINIYLGFFNQKKENPSKVRLEKLYTHSIRIGDLKFPNKDWDFVISSYRQATEYLPEKFNGHQKLIAALSEKCKIEYETCIETRNYINQIKPIFLEKKDELNKHLTKLDKIIKENYIVKR